MPSGQEPNTKLVMGGDGYLYGSTRAGGTTVAYGTLFKISTGGLLIPLHSFNGADGYAPTGLAAGRDGYLYGTTGGGGTMASGSAGSGTVFKMSTGGALTTLYTFTGGADGSGPNQIVEANDGAFYGTTSGTVFKITTNGILTTLHTFTGGADGGTPLGALIQGSDGYLYGTTSGINGDSFGTVFRISTSGAISNLYVFDGQENGGCPFAGLVQGSDGYLYGTTQCGGPYIYGLRGYGTVFQISTNGALTNLYSFSGSDGGSPEGALLQGSDGSLYGTTSGGGDVTNAGTVFQITTDGTFTSLYSFSGGGDGDYPQAGLTQGGDGSFYGTTAAGVASGFGTIFRLTVEQNFQASILSNGALGLTWNSMPGATYQVQYSSDLNSTNWLNLGGVITGTGAILSETDSVTNGPQRFYRLLH
jgi:uncharacterized repeat protein (TIGR03803 family)